MQWSKAPLKLILFPNLMKPKQLHHFNHYQLLLVFHLAKIIAKKRKPATKKMSQMDIEPGLTTFGQERTHHDPFSQELLVTKAPSILRRRNLKTQLNFFGLL